MFNKEQVFEIIEKTLSEHNGVLELSDLDKIKTYITYERLMSEKTNVNKTIQEQEDLITAIIIGRNTTNKDGQVESWERIFTEHSDAKHLSYFDNFLRQGELEKILKALKKNGISTEVLRPIRKNQENDYTIDGVTVIQKIEEDDSGYKYVSYFEISYNGKVIYSYGADNSLQQYSKESSFAEAIDRIADRADEYSESQKTLLRKTSNNNGMKTVTDVYVDKNGNVRSRVMGHYIDKNGVKRFGFLGGGYIK